MTITKQRLFPSKKKKGEPSLKHKFLFMIWRKDKSNLHLEDNALAYFFLQSSVLIWFEQKMNQVWSFSSLHNLKRKGKLDFHLEGNALSNSSLFSTSKVTAHLPWANVVKSRKSALPPMKKKDKNVKIAQTECHTQ